jgi:hypothetical protein
MEERHSVADCTSFLGQKKGKKFNSIQIDSVSISCSFSSFASPIHQISLDLFLKKAAECIAYLMILLFSYFSANGFTTRSDIGPARDDMAPTPETIAAAAAAAPKKDDDEEKRNSGDEDDTGLLASGPYEADDIEV